MTNQTQNRLTDLGQILFYMSEEDHPQGFKQLLAFNNTANTISYNIMTKTDTVGLNTCNLSFKGTFVEKSNQKLEVSITHKRDAFYGPGFSKYAEPICFTLVYKINDDKKKLALDSELQELQWGNDPIKNGFQDDCYHVYERFYPSLSMPNNN